MGRLRQLKEFYDQQFELREEWDEPYRGRAQRCVDVARKTGYMAAGAAVMLLLGESVLAATGPQEAVDIASDAFVYGLGGYMLVNLGCVARLGQLRVQQANDEQHVA